ncbi:hypothetical protein DEO72_LG2g4776 [Vigna unguiculata]|uniref:Uncharacterized protein n=1 Tax=Vigna unguiculata TaxID=3917 RepID=A0A4D6L7C9_VIGUN|nr:hypothetical protein DEO72_LG2g4776 [Vigna unguiculata]
MPPASRSLRRRGVLVAAAGGLVSLVTHARTKTSSLRRRSRVAAKMRTRSQGLELWWWPRWSEMTKRKPSESRPHKRERRFEKLGITDDTLRSRQRRRSWWWPQALRQRRLREGGVTLASRAGENEKGMIREVGFSPAMLPVAAGVDGGVPRRPWDWWQRHLSWWLVDLRHQGRSCCL